MDRLTRDESFPYLKIPTTDPTTSARFHEGVVGWNVRRRDGSRRSFDVASGYVSGWWELDQQPATEAALLSFIYVDGIDEAVDPIGEHGGAIVRAPYPERDVWVA